MKGTLRHPSLLDGERKTDLNQIKFHFSLGKTLKLYTFSSEHPGLEKKKIQFNLTNLCSVKIQ